MEGTGRNFILVNYNKQETINTIILANRLLKTLQDMIINKIMDQYPKMNKVIMLDLYRDLNNNLLSLESEILFNHNNIGFKYQQLLNVINLIKTIFKNKRIKIS